MMKETALSISAAILIIITLGLCNQPLYGETIEFDNLLGVAENGDAAAQYKIGLAYEDGNGVSKNYEEAIKWYKKAAEQNNIQAQITLGLAYYKGKDTTQNYQEAMKWYKKASEQGSIIGQTRLGIMYELGEGAAENYVEAYKWYLLAAKQKDKIALDLEQSLQQKMSRQQIAQAEAMAKEFRAGDNKEVLSIPGHNAKITSYGKGFVVTSDGYIITSYNVIKNSDNINVIINKCNKIAICVLADIANDIAILKIDKGEYRPIPLKSNSFVSEDEHAYTVSFPRKIYESFKPDPEQIVVNNLSDLQNPVYSFNMNTASQATSLGEPLIDEMGNCIGLIVARHSDQSSPDTNYAIKSSVVLKILEDVPQVSEHLRTPFDKKGNEAELMKETEKSVVSIYCY